MDFKELPTSRMKSTIQMLLFDISKGNADATPLQGYIEHYAATTNKSVADVVTQLKYECKGLCDISPLLKIADTPMESVETYFEEEQEGPTGITTRLQLNEMRMQNFITEKGL